MPASRKEAGEVSMGTEKPRAFLLSALVFNNWAISLIPDAIFVHVFLYHFKHNLLFSFS